MVIVLFLTGCSFRLYPSETLYTFDDALRLVGSGHIVTADGAGFNVMLDWEILNDWNDSWMTFLQVVNADGTLIVQNDISPNMPTEGEQLHLIHRVRPPETGWIEGEYKVVVGWYLNDEPLVLARGTDNETDTLFVFAFSVDNAGRLLIQSIETEEND